MTTDFRPVSKIISCTNPADDPYVLYECPANARGHVVLIYIVNANGKNSIDLRWYRAADAAHYYILGGKNFSTGDFIELSGSYIVMEPGDKLEVNITTVGIIDALCTVEEHFIANKANR